MNEAARVGELSEGKQTHIHIRTTKERKTAYLKAANREGKNLTQWIEYHCDKATGEK